VKLVLSITLVVAIAVAATAGLAGGALKTKKATISLPADSGEESATAKCKRGFRAVSGGFDGPGFSAEGAGAPYQIPIDSLRESRRAWTSSAYNDSSEPGDFVAFVNCSDELPKLKTRSATVTIANGDAGTATARCPRRGEAIGGGFAAGVANTDANALVFVSESRRNGKRGWAVSGDNQSGMNAGEALDLTALAYCAKRKVGLKTESAMEATDAAISELSAKARCKRNQVAVSGGFSSNPEPFSRPFESRRAGRRGWVASIGAYPSPEDEDTLDVFAYCLKQDAL
jgi:hypothetical protein